MNIFASRETQIDDLLRRICLKIQLSQTQRKSAEERYHAVAKWLADDSGFLSKVNPEIYPQGSLRIGTTVKPIIRNEYDLDLVCELQIDFFKHSPKVVIDAVEARMKEHETYRKMIKRPKARCIRLEYANEFHLDIVPACPNKTKNNGAIKIPDREVNQWMDSNPKGYGDWFEQKARQYFSIVEARKIEPLPPEEDGHTKPALKYAVQLIKRNRDIVFQNSNVEEIPKSIVITTLSALEYSGNPSIQATVSELLSGITRIIAKSNSHPFSLQNPAALEENLTELWKKNGDAYIAFQKWATNLSLAWNRLNQQKGVPEIVKILESLFGEKITQESLQEQTEDVNKARSMHNLVISTSTGAIQTLPKQSNRDVVSVRPNTFYGDSE